MKRPGCIVNVGSTASMREQAYTADDGASKAGLLMLTKCIAMEFATRGLRANCVSPGGVNKPFGRFFQLRDVFEPQLLEYTRPPLRTNFAEPEDIAKVIAFAASDDARMITGAALVADLDDGVNAARLRARAAEAPDAVQAASGPPQARPSPAPQAREGAAPHRGKYLGFVCNLPAARALSAG